MIEAAVRTFTYLLSFQSLYAKPPLRRSVRSLVEKALSEVYSNTGYVTDK